MYSKLAVVAVLIAAAVGVIAEEYNCAAEGRVCQNGGICHDSVVLNGNNPGASSNGWATPMCICSAPYGGPDCSYTIRECKDSPCKNGGTCSPADCRAGSAFKQYDCFTCACPREWTGAPAYGGGGGVCDWPVAINDCTNNVCANGGTCTSSTATSYSCACVTGWFGGSNNNCTRPTCANSNGEGACQNGGTCSGNTCQCGQYSGTYCEIPRFCDNPNACPAGATCNNGAGSTGSCTLPPWCDSHTCLNGATCDNGDSECLCTAGFDGLYCNTTQFCSNPSNVCQNGGTCQNGANTPAGGAGECTCPKGWVGRFCEEQLNGCGRDTVGCAGGLHSSACGCTDKTSCDNNGYNTRCDCSSSTGGLQYYDCRCNSTSVSKCPGFVYPGVPGRNVDMVCQNGGTCREVAETTFCDCRDGFWGDKCQNYDNPCLNNPCENGGRCGMTSETNGYPADDRFWAYTCTCKWPFYGTNCEYTAPISTDGRDPVVCGPDTCQHGGTCGLNTWNTGAGNYLYVNPFTGQSEQGEPYTCSCPTPIDGRYGWWGKNCENQIEQCAPGTCANNGKCFNTGPAGSFQCSCPCGYSGDRCELVAAGVNGDNIKQFSGDGGGVGYRLDFCSQEPYPCENGGTCGTAINGQDFKCNCPSGWAGPRCTWRVRSSAAGVVPSLFAVAAAVAVAVAMKH